MTTRLARALLALALSLVAVPALATPADAAPKGPAVPTVKQVARIYPHLKGGTADVDSQAVPALTGDCEEGKPVRGSRGTMAHYEPSESPSYEDLFRQPFVLTGALSFRSVRDASDYYDELTESATRCLSLLEPDPAAHGVTVTTRKIRFGLGDERYGSTTTASRRKRTAVNHTLVVRDGRIVTVSVVFAAGRTPTGKAVRLARVTLRTAL